MVSQSGSSWWLLNIDRNTSKCHQHHVWIKTMLLRPCPTVRLGKCHSVQFSVLDFSYSSYPRSLKTKFCPLLVGNPLRGSSKKTTVPSLKLAYPLKIDPCKKKNPIQKQKPHFWVQVTRPPIIMVQWKTFFPPIGSFPFIWRPSFPRVITS